MILFNKILSQLYNAVQIYSPSLVHSSICYYISYAPKGIQPNHSKRSPINRLLIVNLKLSTIRQILALLILNITITRKSSIIKLTSIISNQFNNKLSLIMFNQLLVTNKKSIQSFNKIISFLNLLYLNTHWLLLHRLFNNQFNLNILFHDQLFNNLYQLNQLINNRQ